MFGKFPWYSIIWPELRCTRWIPILWLKSQKNKKAPFHKYDDPCSSTFGFIHKMSQPRVLIGPSHFLPHLIGPHPHPPERVSARLIQGKAELCAENSFWGVEKQKWTSGKNPISKPLVNFRHSSPKYVREISAKSCRKGLHWSFYFKLSYPTHWWCLKKVHLLLKKADLLSYYDKCKTTLCRLLTLL